MLTLIQANLLPILASFLIGLVTARWTFRRPTVSNPRSGPEAP
ncbi:MAG TPA: hypothetical protein VF702_12990 [Allosphingosinicella sp.]|jgi:hypothetical protein